MYKLHSLQHPDWHRTAVLVTATFISLKLFIIIVCFIFFFFSKIIPSFFVDKASCTRQFESELSLHSLASLFPIKKGFFLPLRLSCKESSTFSPSPSSSGSRDVTALLGARNRCALRLADHQRSSPVFAGWDRLGTAC